MRDTAQVLIIGGGVIGLSIARSLRKAGVTEITVLDKGSIGREASWAAAGILGPQAEADAPGTFFDMCCGSRDLYPAFADELLEETGVDIELDRTGTLYLSYDDASDKQLLDRYYWQRHAELAVETLGRQEIAKLEPHVLSRVTLGLHFPNDWQVENRKLLHSLAKYAEQSGIEVHENAEVMEVVTKGGRSVGVRTANGTFLADNVILATGAWTSLIKLGDSAFPFEVKPIRGQIVAFGPSPDLLTHVIYTHRGYLVPRRDGRILAGSTTEDVGFEKGVMPAAASALREMAAEIASEFRTMPVADHWAGLRPFAPDGMPVLGAIPGFENLFVATAHYRNGILLAPLTAKIVADAVLSREGSNYLDEFGPARLVSEKAAANH